MPHAVGRKIGFTNRSIWPRYGVFEPIWGTVYEDTLLTASGGATNLSLAGIHHPRIEPEICFKLRAAPQGADQQSLISAIEWVAHSIEIVQCQRADWKVTLPECIAQNGLHARLVVGSPVPLTAEIAAVLPAVSVILLKNGKEIERGTGANALDGPLSALGHLVHVLAKDGGPALRAGEIISTGTLTDAHPVAPGEVWSTRLAGAPLEGLSVWFR